MAEALGHDAFAGQFGGGHATQRFTEALDVPRITAGVGDDVDLGFGEGVGGERQALVGVGGSGVEHAPSAQGDRRGADAEDGAGAFAENIGVEIGDSEVAGG